MDLKIATHDSATGEKGKGLISWLFTPFAKTQSKTIKEQYEAGCRNFDLRVRKFKGVWRCAHGPWRTKKTFKEIIQEIALFEDRCLVSVTYEGFLDDYTELIDLYNKCKTAYKHIIWGTLAVKKGKNSQGPVKIKYDIIFSGQTGYSGGTQGFLPLDGRSWHILIPIPWLWKKVYYNTPSFNTSTFTYVDFL